MDHRRRIIEKMLLESQLALLQSLIERMQKLAGNSAPSQIKPQHSPTLGDGGCRGPSRHSADMSSTTADTPEASDSVGEGVNIGDSDAGGARKLRRIVSTLVCAPSNIQEGTLRPIAEFVESAVRYMIDEFTDGLAASGNLDHWNKWDKLGWVRISRISRIRLGPPMGLILKRGYLS